MGVQRLRCRSVAWRPIARYLRTSVLRVRLGPHCVSVDHRQQLARDPGLCDGRAPVRSCSANPNLLAKPSNLASTRHREPALPTRRGISCDRQSKARRGTTEDQRASERDIQIIFWAFLAPVFLAALILWIGFWLLKNAKKLFQVQARLVKCHIRDLVLLPGLIMRQSCFRESLASFFVQRGGAPELAMAAASILIAEHPWLEADYPISEELSESFIEADELRSGEFSIQRGELIDLHNSWYLEQFPSRAVQERRFNELTEILEKYGSSNGGGSFRIVDDSLSGNDIGIYATSSVGVSDQLSHALKGWVVRDESVKTLAIFEESGLRELLFITRSSS